MTGSVAIPARRGHHVGVATGTISPVTLVSVPLALNVPDCGRSVTYGVAIPALLLHGREPGNR